MGVKAKKLIDASTEQIAKILGVKTSEVIYTSGSSESNNLALKGIAFKYQNRGKNIITTRLVFVQCMLIVGIILLQQN